MSNLIQKIGEALPALSHLRCNECGKRKDIGEVSDYLRAGWPMHCGYTMELRTEAQEQSNATA